MYHKKLVHIIMEAAQSQDLRVSKLETQENQWLYSKFEGRRRRPNTPAPRQSSNESKSSNSGFCSIQAFSKLNEAC